VRKEDVQKEGEVAIRLLLADDHALLREGIVSLLADYPEFVVVAEAEDGHRAIELARRVQPDVVVLDLMLPGKDGLQVTGELRWIQPDIKIIIFSARTEWKMVDRALAAGADGYVSKASCTDDLVEALRCVMKGDRFVSSGLGKQSAVVEQQEVDLISEMALLTRRERQVLGMVAGGLTNKRIAHRLGISVYTVRNHRHRLMNKLGVHDTATLTRLAMAWGVLDQV